MNKYLVFLFCSLLISCTDEVSDSDNSDNLNQPQLTESTINQDTFIVDTPSLIVLGTVQDAGSPHINCHKSCCDKLHDNPDPTRMITSLGFIDPGNKQKFLFEASPDISRQLAKMSTFENFSTDDIPNGVFLTHAHIGHYTGLMYFGKEATNSSSTPVYTMPKMAQFLKENGPWSQLITEKNIVIDELTNATKRKVNSNLSVIPLLVPHRDEYSETIGFKIIGPTKTALFIPDIDKWDKWDKNILSEIETVDYAFLDATFYDESELPNRKISEIPHPLVAESTELFEGLSANDKSKIYFIHLNHTNPLLDSSSNKKEQIELLGYNLAEINDVFEM